MAGESPCQHLSCARQAASNAETLRNLTESYARSGVGLEADHRRSLTEREHRRREVEAAVGELEVVSVSTRSSAEHMGLKVGDPVTAIIKSTEVLVAKD